MSLNGSAARAPLPERARAPDALPSDDLDIERAAALLRALAGRHRLLVLFHLAEGVGSVDELAQILGLAPATVARCLRALFREGIIDAATTRGGGRYRIRSQGVRRLLDDLVPLARA